MRQLTKKNIRVLPQTKQLTPFTRRPSNTNSPTTRTATLGTQIFNGYVTYEERDFRLVGRERFKTFADMQNNIGIVNSSIEEFLNLIETANWTISQTKEQMAADPNGEIKQLFKDIFLGETLETSFAEVNKRMAMSKFIGYSLAEWVAMVRPDGKIGLLDIAPVPQRTVERWDLDPQTKVLLGIEQRNDSEPAVYIDREKLIYIADKSQNDSPEGLGIFRKIAQLAIPYLKLQDMERSAHQFSTGGVLIGRAPLTELSNNQNLTDEEILEINKQITDFLVAVKRGDVPASLFLDSDPYKSIDEAGRPVNIPKFDIQKLTGDTDLSYIRDLLKALEYQLAVSMGSEFLLIGDTGGSYNLVEQKINNYKLIVDAQLKTHERVLNRDLVKVIGRMNGIPDEMIPTLRVESILSINPEHQLNVFKELAAAGFITPGDPIINELRSKNGFSEMDDDMVDLLMDRQNMNDELERMRVERPMMNPDAEEVPEDESN